MVYRAAQTFRPKLRCTYCLNPPDECLKTSCTFRHYLPAHWVVVDEGDEVQGYFFTYSSAMAMQAMMNERDNVDN